MARLSFMIWNMYRALVIYRYTKSLVVTEACRYPRQLTIYCCLVYIGVEQFFLIFCLAFPFIWRHHLHWSRVAKVRPFAWTHGLGAGRGLYCALPTVTQASVYAVSFDWQPHLVNFYDKQGILRTNLDPHKLILLNSLHLTLSQIKGHNPNTGLNPKCQP